MRQIRLGKIRSARKSRLFSSPSQKCRLLRLQIPQRFGLAFLPPSPGGKITPPSSINGCCRSGKWERGCWPPLLCSALICSRNWHSIGSGSGSRLGVGLGLTAAVLARLCPSYRMPYSTRYDYTMLDIRSPPPPSASLTRKSLLPISNHVRNLSHMYSSQFISMQH